MDTLGRRVRIEREKKGWTQRALARRAGVGHSTIVGIEVERVRETRKLVPIARALGVAPQWLETGRGPREAPAGNQPYIEAESLEDLAARLLDRGPDEIGRLWSLILAGAQQRG
ncbi:helix-turn-helix transcriptional regulator [Chromobacterium violaceum]|uniref:helix-turn-helix domain-containing protein n=1 Tax=Chromobacterium violaceum TaxID=536 RepID=UPI00385B1903